MFPIYVLLSASVDYLNGSKLSMYISMNTQKQKRLVYVLVSLLVCRPLLYLVMISAITIAHYQTISTSRLLPENDAASRAERVMSFNVTDECAVNDYYSRRQNNHFYGENEVKSLTKVAWFLPNSHNITRVIWERDIKHAIVSMTWRMLIKVL